MFSDFRQLPPVADQNILHVASFGPTGQSGGPQLTLLHLADGTMNSYDIGNTLPQQAL